jgi:ketohexokinase
LHIHLPRLLIVGNCILDQIWQIDQFPQQDAEFRAQARLQQLGGNACNTATILAKLGHRVDLISQLADDADANWIRQQLQHSAIGTLHCPSVRGGMTPISSIWLNSSNGSRTICHYRDLPELSLQQLTRIQIDAYQWIHFEGRNIPVLQDYLPLLQNSYAVPISLEIEKPREHIEKLLPYVNVVIVSSDYLSQRQISPQACINEFAKINPQMKIVCTQGSNGLIASSAEDGVIKMEAVDVAKVIDSIGAGDCFIAGLISRLSQQIAFKQALSFANKLAASKVQHQGMNFRPELIDE